MLYKGYLCFLLVLFEINKNVVSYELKKCCPLNHVLNSTTTSCVENNNNSSFKEWLINEDLLQKLPKIFKKSIPNVGKDKELNIPCSSPKTMVLKWDEDFHINNNTGDLVTSATTAKNKTFPLEDYCLDEVQSEDGMKSTVAIICKCNKENCLNLCCKHGYALDMNSTFCEKVNSPSLFNWKIDEISEPENEQQYFTIPDYIEQCSPYFFKNSKEDEFKILANGTLHYTLKDNITNEGWIKIEEISCVGLIRHEDGSTEVNALICDPSSTSTLEEKIRKYGYSTFLLISAIFLLLTLIIHLILPKLRRTLMGLSLMAHCACMLIAYISLIIINLIGDTVSDLPCIILGYLAQYSFFAGFCWLSVICFDISTTFRSFRNMAQRNAFRKFKWFLLYTIFAMGLSTLLFIITFVADKKLDSKTQAYIKPNIGVDYCFFPSNTKAIIIYFYGPFGLLLFLNVLLFVFTAYKIIQLIKNPDLNGRRNSNDNATMKKRVLLLVKLIAIMGLSWIFEIISWAFGGSDYLWYLTDAINVLRPIFIFVMFCCKLEVWYMLKESVGYRANRTINRLSRRLGFRQPEVEINNVNERNEQRSRDQSLGSMETLEENIM